MKKASMRVALALMAALISVALVGCEPKDLVSTGDEIEIGRQAAGQIESKYQIETDPAANRLVNGIGQTLLRGINARPGITYRFKVVRDPAVNAFSLPGGWIYVQTGLINATRGNTSQLAGVMAHEIAHVQARHSAQMIGRQSIYGTAIGAFTKGDTARIASIFANVQMLQYSRAEEHQADKLAIDYLLPSPYDPQGLINFFKLLMRSEGSGSPEFLRSHPLSKDRVDRLQAYLDTKRGR